MNRSRFMIVAHGVSAKRWIQRYGLEPFTVPCTDCGALLTTSIPIAYRQLRGLITPQCSCGSSDRPYCFVRANKYGNLFDAPLDA